jgi:hypoxanthine phosphoribosyltransferase
MTPHPDIDRVLFDEATIHQRLDALAARVTADFAGRDLALVALLNGAVVTAADLIRRIPLPLRLECVAAASYHGAAQSSGSVTFGPNPLPDVKGRDVLLVDDILDTGLTLAAVTRKLSEEAGARSVRTLVLLRKQRPRLAPADAEYVGFDIPDAFVVGYGLDFAGRYRNLPYIGTLRPELIATPPAHPHAPPER